MAENFTASEPTSRQSPLVDDLHRMGIRPKVGLRLTFCDEDADDEGRQVYLCADGRLYLDAEGKWCTEVDEDTFRTVPRV